MGGMPPGGAMPPGMPGGGMGGGMGGMGGGLETALAGMDPQTLMMLLQMLEDTQGGMPPGMGQGAPGGGMPPGPPMSGGY